MRRPPTPYVAAGRGEMTRHPGAVRAAARIVDSGISCPGRHRRLGRDGNGARQTRHACQRSQEACRQRAHAPSPGDPDVAGLHRGGLSHISPIACLATRTPAGKPDGRDVPVTVGSVWFARATTDRGQPHGCCKPPVQARRPSGRPAQAQRLVLHRGARLRAGRGRGSRQDPLSIAGSRHARLDERRQVIHRAGGHRRGHARPRRRSGRRIQPSQAGCRRPCHRTARGAGVRHRQRERRHEGRPGARPAAGVPQHARDAGHDRVLRPAGDRPARRG